MPAGLSAADTGARPAYSVDISGDLAIVGASWEDRYGGAAYVMRKDGDRWAVEQRLVPSDLGPYDHFGQSVRIDGDRIVVSSPWHDLQRGASYEFSLDGGRWVQDRKIEAGEEAVAGRLAANMALMGGQPEDDVLPAGAADIIGALESETGAAAPPAAPAELTAPRWVFATDSLFEDRVRVTWENTGQDAIVYEIRRDTELIALVPSDLSIYRDYEVELNHTADYCVVVSDMAGEETESVCDSTGGGTRILFAPVSLDASDGKYLDGVHLSWIGISTIRDGYVIYRDGAPIDSTAAGVTYYVDTSADPATFPVDPYTYEVRAYVDGGYESATASDDGWRGTKLPPQSVSATDGQYLDRVIIIWKAQPDSIEALETTGYKVYRNGYLIGSSADSVTSFVDSSLVYNIVYEYCVSAVGTGDIESMGICDEGNCGLTMPGDVSASDSTYDDRVRITWYDLNEFEDGYEIFRDVPIAGGIGKNETRPIVTALPDSAIATVGRDVQVYDDRDAEPGVTYLYYVRAFSNEGSVSPEAEDTGVRSVILPPTNVEATDGDFEGRTGITWESASTTMASFLIYRDGNLIKTLDKSNRYYNDGGGVAGVEYVYSVRAMTAMGVKSGSGADAGYRELKKPSLVDASDDEYENKVTVTWSDNSSIEDGYRIYRREIDESGVLAGYLAGGVGTPGTSFDVETDGTYAYVTDSGEGLQIVSINDPANPVIVGSVDTPDYAQGIDIAGDYAYVADGDAGLQIIDISNPRSPAIVGNYNPTGHVRDVEVSGDYAYLAEDGTGLRIVDVSDPTDPDPRGSTATIGDVSGIAIYGDYAFVSIYTSATGLQIINISDPMAPSLYGFYFGVPCNCVSLYGDYALLGTDSSFEVLDLGNVSAPLSSPTVAGTFDTEGYVYRIDIEGDLAYVPDYTFGLRAVDISDPSSPTESWSLGMPDAWRGVAVAGNSVCMVSETYGLRMVSLVGDLIDSIDPNLTSFVDYSAVSSVQYAYTVAAYDTTSGGAAGESPHGADQGVRTLIAPTMVNASDGMYEDRIEITWYDNSNYEDGYYIYRNDTLVDSTAYGDEYYTTYIDYSPALGTSHVYGIAAFDSVGPSAAAADSGYSMILAPISFNASDIYEDKIEITWIDRSNIEEGFRIYRDGTLIKTLDEPDVTSFTTHNAVWLAGLYSAGDKTDVVVSGDYAYFATGSSGLQIYDISDPDSLVIVGSYDTPGTASGVDVAGDYAYVADFNNLQIINVSNPGSPTLAGTWTSPAGGTVDVVVIGDYAFTADYAAQGLMVADISDTSNLTEYWSEDAIGEGSYYASLSVYGGYLYMAQDDGFSIFNVQNPEDPIRIGGAGVPGSCTGIAVAGDYAYIAASSEGLFMYDISVPGSPQAAGLVGSSLRSKHLVVDGEFLYAACQSDGLEIYNITDPGNPVFFGKIGYPVSDASGIDIAGGKIYVADGNSGMEIISQPIDAGIRHNYCVHAYKSDIESEGACDDGILPMIDPYATTTELYTKLNASDGSSGGYFGHSVAISGDRAVIGGADPYTSYSSLQGSAYIFDLVEGAWTETEKLAAAGLAASDNFGSSVAISGDYVVVGAVEVTGGRSGSAYVFELVDGVWTEDAKLNPSNGASGDFFGSSVAIDGDYIIVGAEREDTLGSSSGSAYVFHRDTGGAWLQTQILTATDGGSNDRFGNSVSMSGDLAVIGASGGDKAYIFKRGPGDDWGQTQVLSGGYGFGRSVSIDRHTVIVGCDRDYVSGQYTGSSSVFELDPDGTVIDTQKLTASDGGRNDQFGYSVAISGDIAIVGAFDNVYWMLAGTGWVYVFERGDDGIWSEKQKFAAFDRAFGDGFGCSVSLDGVNSLIGARQDDDGGSNSGSVYASQIVQAPGEVTATDGTLESRIRITWQDNSLNERGFRIYRDGEPVGTVDPNVQGYEDYDAEAGRTYVYGVATLTNDVSNESSQTTDLGWRPANGNITGRIATVEGAPSDSIWVAVTPSLTMALLLDGNGGYVSVPDSSGQFQFSAADSFTVEAWIKYSGDGGSAAGDGTILSISDPESGAASYPFTLSNMRSTGFPGQLRFALSDGTLPVEVSSDSIRFNDNEWHHVACVHDPSDSEIRLFVDGEHQGTTSYVSLGDITNDEPLTFGAGPSAGSWYGGQIDEVRIWNTSRSLVEIQSSMLKPLTGKENGLAAYWPISRCWQEAEEDIGFITDIAENANYGILNNGAYWTDDCARLDIDPVTDVQGNYVLKGLYYGTEDEFEVIPYNGNRQFDPPVKRVVLTTESPVENQVNFIDVSNYTVSGKIMFAGTDCPAPDIAIIVDGEPGGITDKNGRFDVSVGQGEHTIMPEYGLHEFDPALLELKVTEDMVVDDPESGAAFIDTTTYTLSGRLGGGCGRPVGNITISIRSENNCLITELSYAADATMYTLDLPPQNYYVSASIDPQSITGGLSITDVVEYFQNLGARQAAMDSMDVELDFVYRAPLRVAITGFEEYVETCDGPLGFDGRTFPDSLPVIPQNTGLILTVEVNEDYGDGGLCPLDSGTVTIYDEIYDGPSDTTLTILNGVAQFRSYASTPSLIVGRVDDQGNDRSFQKSVTAVVEVEGRTPVTETEWVLVTGHVQGEGADYIAGHVDIPLYILRDPPGDGSFSMLEEGQKIRTTVEWDNDTGFFGRGLLFDIWTGVTTKWFVGLGGGFINEASKSISSIETDWVYGTTTHTEDMTEITLTMKETLSTSDDDLFVGGKGDVFLGAGYNFIVSEVDVIGIDYEACKVTKGISVGFQPDTIYTTYAYTQQFIKQTLVPDLENLSSYYDSLYEYSGDITHADTAGIAQREADRWNYRLFQNDSLKAYGASEERVVENLSFSAGAEYTYFWEKDSTRSHEFTEKGEIDGDVLFGNLGFRLPFGTAVNISGHTKHYKEWLKDNWVGTDSTWTQTISYTLKDGDIGDHFTVNVGYDGMYPSPVFDVLAGVSSCPYEPWPDHVDSLPRMLSRDLPDISIVPPERNAVPADEAAVFTLNMANLSPSGESRRYVLKVLNQYNPYGAVIKVGDYPIYQGLEYFIDADQSQEVTVTVERGPSRYNYENLALFMYAPCEYLLWEKEGALQLADTVFFDVTFDAPCSDITLTLPESGWVYNADSLDATLPIAILLGNYEWQLSEEPDDTIQSIGFQYRRLGSGEEGPSEWVETPASSPGEDETLVLWYPPALLEDGVYELRAYTQCAGGRGYSDVATGTIDLRGPQVLGTPEPSDGVLSFGEDISITFNEPITCDSIGADSIVITYLDGPRADSLIGCDFVCDDRMIVITPTDSTTWLDGRRIRVSVAGVYDRLGNLMDGEAIWEFDYLKSQFAWSDADIVGESAFGDPCSMIAELVNGTGEEVDFSFTDQPSWITDIIPDAGTVLPGETQAVEFVVQSELPTGSYHDEVVVEAAGAEGTSMAILTLDLTVGDCAPPDWTVNPYGFEHSMNIIAKLEIGGAKSSDGADMVAAFVGGELRGVANIDTVDVYDYETMEDTSYLAFLTVYSNRPSGETVRFQIWDASDCELYNATEESYPFDADTLIGTPDTAVVLTAADIAGGELLAIEVREGWNWISTNIRTPDMSVGNILADLNLETGDLIKSQSSFSQFLDNPDPEIYPAWVPSFDLDNVSGYLVNLSQAGTIMHTGATVSVDSIIPVVHEWNWIGYLPPVSMTVGEALDDLALQLLLEDDDIVKGQDGFAQYLEGSWYGTLSQMEPGRGYKLYLESASPVPGTDGFNYPDVSSSSPEPPLAAAEAGEGEDDPEAGTGGGPAEAAAAAPDWAVNAYAYQFNMTMTAVVRVDGLESADGRDVIGAFVGDDCRGVASPEYVSGLRRYEAFLMIHSNEASGETVEFRVFNADEGTVCYVTEQVDWTADAVVGTVTQPFVLTALSGEGEEDGVPKAYALGQNVPNPFNPSTTIQYDVPAGGGNVSLRVYDVSGRLVRTLVDGHEAEGVKSVTWDGTGDRGQRVASGIYFYRMQAPGFAETKKMVLLR